MIDPEILLIVLVISFIASLPGLAPLILWLRRTRGDLALNMAARPALPWWARGFVGQFAAFLTANFWLGLAIGLLAGLGENLFNFELSERWYRSIRFGVMGGSFGLITVLYQRAAAIAFPPLFNLVEKNALKALRGDPETAVEEYQRKLGKIFDGPRPLTVEGLNFRDPADPHSPPVFVDWTQVACLPQTFTNQYIVVYLDDPLPPALSRVAQPGRGPHYYRLYFSDAKPRSAGIKMQALAKHLWVERLRSVGVSSNEPLARRAVNCFD